jgi:hypothetical protein
MEIAETVAHELTPEEADELLDTRAQRYLGISGEEFKRRWAAGELDPHAPAVTRVAMLLPGA